MSTENKRRRRGRILFWGLLLLAILLVVCIGFHVKRIPQDIANLAGQALTSAGFDATLLQAADGRVAILSGEIDAETTRERLVETVRSVPGVRRVIDRLVVVKSDPARLSLAVSADGVLLSGIMPDQTMVDRVVKATATIYGENKVTNRISIQKQVGEPVWLDGLLALLPELKTTDAMRIEAAGSEAVISGAVDTPETRARIAAQAENLLGATVAVDNRIEVAVPQQPAKLRYRISGQEVYLQGELPDQQSVDDLVAATRAIYGEENVKNELTISEHITRPDWLAGFQALLPALQTMAAADIAIEEDGVTLRGVVASNEERAAIEKRAGALLGPLPLNNQIVVKTPAAVKTQPTELVQLPTLFFKHARTELTENSKPLLEEITDTLKRRPDLRVAVATHTDSSGEEMLNTDLSDRRAKAIVQALASGGIDPGRLDVQTYGESRPVAENTTTEGRARNRRVEFKVIE